jgi:hypothetical protein
MSTISVETTARLMICWMASSRSAALRPAPAGALHQGGADRLKQTDFLANSRASSLVQALRVTRGPLLFATWTSPPIGACRSGVPFLCRLTIARALP